MKETHQNIISIIREIGIVLPVVLVLLVVRSKLPGLIM